MKIKFTLITITILFYSQFVSAQNKQISGIVSFANSSEVSSGVTVNAKGINVSTSTDKNGKYSLNVPSSASMLVFSFVGMKKMEEKIDGRSVINVTLSEEVVEFETVVVTALGLKSERDKFASSVSTLKGNIIAQSGETGVLNGLSGKVDRKSVV